MPDTAFRPPVARPHHAPGRGPVVAVDAAHHNFHTIDGRYAPFAALLQRDGYQVEAIATPFTDASLAPVRLLVVANALAAANETSWVNPVLPAFTPAEVAAVRRWVEGGGALLLIADHMPFGGAAARSARRSASAWPMASPSTPRAATFLPSPARRARSGITR